MVGELREARRCCRCRLGGHRRSSRRAFTNALLWSARVRSDKVLGHTWSLARVVLSSMGIIGHVDVDRPRWASVGA